VFIDTSGPEFIGWDDINGIDEVKQEIEEIIDYLKNPALLRLRGVNRIGGVLLAGAPGTGKTLLAKAIAAESGVKMFTCSGGQVACSWVCAHKSAWWAVVDAVVITAW
jgi:cell division protease FtsH